MKTSAITNPTVTSGIKSPAKPPSASPDILFNQVLSRELADRGSAEQSRPAMKDNAPASPAPQGAKAATQTGKPAAHADNKANASREAQTASAEESKAKPAGDGEASAVEESKADPEAEKEETTTAEAATVAEELLALVANLNQPATAQAANAPAADESTQDSDAALPGSAKSAEAALAMLTAQASGVPSAADAAQVVEAGQQSDTAASTGKIELLDGRAELVSKDKDASADSNAFDAALAQSKDGKEAREAKTKASTEIGNGAGAMASAQTETETVAAQQSASEVRAAKTAPDAQPVAAPVNIAAQAQAPLQKAQAAATQMADRLAPRVGSSGWDQALGQKVVWMVAGSHQSASLTLNPPDLGPLQVVLNVSNNQATANFTAAQPEVRQALENAMPKLRDMLGEAGIQLGQANVSAGSPNQQQGGFGERQASSSRSSGRGGDDDAPEAMARVTRTEAISSGNGLVDTFA
jgi:flagellar hook-length control protein FliK